MSTPEGNQAGDGAGPNPGPNATPINTAVPPPPPIASTPSHVHVHYSNTPVPKFNGNSDDFGTWKARMLLHFAGIERYMVKILKEGPYVPMAPLSPILDPTGSRRGREKIEEHWSEEERRLVDLDTKLKNMILSSVPESLIPTLVLFPSAKTMWEELLIQFEGGDDTIVTRKVALNKKYESFFALPNEDLTGTYTRFTNLVNQLKGLGVEKDKEILLEKFCDILPTKWSNMILVLRQAKTLHSHTLASLYGAFRYTEENHAQRVVAEQDALNHVSSTSKVTSQTVAPCSALLSSESTPVYSMKKMMSELLESGSSSFSTSDCDETDNDDLVAMIAKTFNRFKAKSNRFSGPSASSATTDKANLTCFKCGKKGHFMKECRSSQFTSQSGQSTTFHKPDDSYKSKYKKLKAQIALMSQEQNKCMMANTSEKWENSDDSSDDEEEVRDVCYMALEEAQQHLVKDDVTSGRWVDIVLKKVSLYDSETDPELKMDIAELLNSDLVFVETVRSDSLIGHETDFTELTTLQSRLKELQDVELAFKAQVLLTEKLEQENNDLKSIIEKEKKVIESWMLSKRPFDAACNQFPMQQKAFLDGNLHVASLVPDLHLLPKEVRPKTEYDMSNPVSTSASQVQSHPEQKSEVVQTATSDKKINLKKSSAQSSSGETSVSKKKNSAPPKPNAQSSGKAKVSEENVLSKLESQIQLLTRQVQSVNARLTNFESANSGSKQNAKPFSKQTKESGKKKKVSKLSTPIKFVNGPGESSSQAAPVKESEPEGTCKGKSSEPIQGWVPKSN